MKFNLKQYLTEKLQSSIIINELLNDNGGFCKYYKVQYNKNSNHLYDKAYRIYTNLNEIFNELHREYGAKYIRKDYDPVSDQQYIKAYHNYMTLFKEYQKLFVRLFSEPSVDVLSCFLGNIQNGLYSNLSKMGINISNISDDMFMK